MRETEEGLMDNPIKETRGREKGKEEGEWETGGGRGGVRRDRIRGRG